MLGIVRIQPPTGSPYFEPPVVRRMALQLPPRRSGGVVSDLGLVYMQSPLPGSVPTTGSEPPIVAMMAANLPNRFRNDPDLPRGIRAHLSGGLMGDGKKSIKAVLFEDVLPFFAIPALIIVAIAINDRQIRRSAVRS